MKIYIGQRQLDDGSYKQLTDVSVLDYVAEDAECTIIVLDGILRKHNLVQVIDIIKLCRKKLRLNGILKIVDIDFDLLVYTHSILNNIIDLNNAIAGSEIRSFITLELTNKLINENAPDLSVHFVRTHNIEFDSEFIRK